MLRVFQTIDCGNGESYATTTETKEKLSDFLIKTIQMSKDSPLFTCLMMGGVSKKSFAEGKKVFLNIWAKKANLRANEFEIRLHDCAQREADPEAIVLNLCTKNMELWYLDPRHRMICDNKAYTVYYLPNIDGVGDILVYPDTVECYVIMIREDGQHIAEVISYSTQHNKFEENGEIKFISKFSQSDSSFQSENVGTKMLKVYMSEDNKKIMFDITNLYRCKNGEKIGTCFVNLFD
jgi:hypothetical protein